MNAPRALRIGALKLKSIATLADAFAVRLTDAKVVQVGKSSWQISGQGSIGVFSASIGERLLTLKQRRSALPH